MKATNYLISYCLLFCMYLTSHAQNPNAFAVHVQTEQGLIEGEYDTQDGIQTYLGIPYAKPPVGELRWKAPQPMEPWEGIKLTKAFGPRAMQAPIFGDMKFRSAGISEDCLYLNVWTPADRTTTDLPVLVYFYGGGFSAGDGSETRYDGESMAKKGMVTVTVNYRLNVFGFLAHPDLSEEAPYKASGNYGLLDQHAALTWVSKNIAAFGGDPNRVTIAGESAGSMSVSAHMASPLSKDLLAGAIGESGASINPTMPTVKLPEAEKMGLAFAEKAGYPSIEALRQLSSRDIYEIFKESGRFGFPVIIDGYFLPKTLPEIFEAGEQAQVPLLLGWNSAEIPAMALMGGLPLTEENYLNAIKSLYPEKHETVLQLYPHGSEKEMEYSATALASDRFISYSTWKWFDLHRKHSDQPVYRYLYSKLRPPLVDTDKIPGLAGGTMEKAEGAPAMPEAIGAPHACEIEYCMGNLPLVKDYAWTEEDYKVSNTMQKYFVNFIKKGNPNSLGLAKWPSAEAEDATPPVMIIDVKCKVIASPDESRYLFLDEAYENKVN